MVKAMLKILMNALVCGKTPVVRLNSFCGSDSFLEENMLARLRSISISENSEDVYSLTLDFSQYEDFNRQFAIPNYFNEANEPILTAEQAGFLPGSKSEVLYYYNEDGELPISMVGDSSLKLVEKYLQGGKSNLSYIEYLEAKVSRF